MKKYTIPVITSLLWLFGNISQDNTFSKADIQPLPNVTQQEVLDTTTTQPILDSTIFEKQMQNVKAPWYRMKRENCAGYVRRTGLKLFDKKYSWGDSWNMRYRNKVIAQVQDTIDIYKLISNGTLTPGMAIGFSNSKSRHKNKKDDQRNKVKYTHVALYVGVNEDFLPEVIHQQGGWQHKSTLTDMIRYGYKPKEILDDMGALKASQKSS